MVRPASIKVTHSVLDPEALLKHVAAAYPLAPVGCELLKLGLNDTYLLRSPGARHVVRVYRAGWRSPDAIAYELELLARLARRGVPMVAATSALDGESLRWVAALEGTRAVAVFPYLRGRPLPWARRPPESRSGSPARPGARGAATTSLVGTLARHSTSSISSTGRWRPFDRSSRTGQRTWITSRAWQNGCESDCVACLQRRSTGAPVTATSERTPQVADGAVTVFDFDFCGEGWRAYDLVIALWHALERQSPAMWEAFLDAYREVRPLPQRDVAAVTLLNPIKHLWGMGLRAATAPVRGATALTTAYLDHRLARFRRWEEESRDETLCQLVGC